MEDFVTANSELTSSAAQPAVTRLQSRKITGRSQAENKKAEELASQPMRPIPLNAQTDTQGQKKQAPHRNRKNRSNTLAGTLRNTTRTGNARIDKGIKKVQDKIRAEVKRKRCNVDANCKNSGCCHCCRNLRQN